MEKGERGPDVFCCWAKSGAMAEMKSEKNDALFRSIRQWWVFFQDRYVFQSVEFIAMEKKEFGLWYGEEINRKICYNIR